MNRALRAIPLAGDYTPELQAFDHARDALDEVPPLAGQKQYGERPEAAPSPLASSVRAEDDRALLRRVTELVYADDPTYSKLDFGTHAHPLPPQSDAEARDAIGRGEHAASLEEHHYPKGSTDDDRWRRFWALNRRWRRVEAWLGMWGSGSWWNCQGQCDAAAQPFRRWLAAWRGYSHDFKRGVDRGDTSELEPVTADLERMAGWYGFPRQYHPKDPANTEHVRERHGDGLETDQPAPRSLSTTAKLAIGAVGVVTMGALVALVRWRG